MFKLMNKDRDPDRYPELKWSHQDSLLLHVTNLYTTKTGAAAGFSLLLCVKTNSSSVQSSEVPSVSFYKSRGG